jgi:pimeloyl-ACP methyl ester carboxylesterase
VTFEIVVPGGRLRADEAGSGPPIVLLHAGVADMASWDVVVPLLVAAEYRVVRYDGRGFGGSVSDDVPYSNRADLLAVLDALDIERAALVGNSRGGHIAFDTAIEFPERIVAVVGVGAGLGGFDHPPSGVERPLFEEYERIESSDMPDAEAAAALAVRIWVDGPGQAEGRVAEPIRRHVHDAVVASYEPGRSNGTPIVLDPPANDRLGELRCPVLAVAGEYDTALVRAIPLRLAAAARDARAVELPGVAHMVGMEAPDQLAALIVEFLDPLRPWA